MPDIGMMELLVIGIVALIVVGPKDLPRMFHTVGQFTGRIRGMAKDFNRAMNDAAKESGVNDISKDLRAMSNPKKMGLDAVNKAFDVDPDKYPEGSNTRKMAEKRAAEVADAKAQADEHRKIREDKMRAAAQTNGARMPGTTTAAPPEPATAPDPVAETDQTPPAASDATPAPQPRSGASET